MDEVEILNRCIERLNELPKARARLLPATVRGTPYPALDVFAEIKTPQGRWLLVPQVKRRLNMIAARHFALVVRERLAAQKRPRSLVLFTDYIGEEVAHELRAQGVNFVDVAGNMFLDLPNGPYIYVEGKRPRIAAERKAGRLFEPTGLKILLTLLLDPETVNWRYRAIADDAGVALGTVGWVMRDLIENGFVEPVGPRKRKLIKRQELFDRWVAGYAEKLRPKLVRRRYRAPETDLGQVLRWLPGTLAEQQVRWAITGGVAADLLIGHFRGEALTLFVKGLAPNIERALRRLQWLPAADGPITLLDGFGNCMFREPKFGDFQVAPPVLIYAELLNMGGERATETAKMIRQRYIEEILRES